MRKIVPLKGPIYSESLFPEGVLGTGVPFTSVFLSTYRIL